MTGIEPAFSGRQPVILPLDDMGQAHNEAAGPCGTYRLVISRLRVVIVVMSEGLHILVAGGKRFRPHPSNYPRGSRKPRGAGVVQSWKRTAARFQPHHASSWTTGCATML